MGGGTVTVVTRGPGGIATYGTLIAWLALVVPDRLARVPDDRRRPRAVRQHVRVLGRLRLGRPGDVAGYFERRYHQRILGLIALPVTLGLLLYATTIPSTSEPLVPALQNNLLLTTHVAVAIVAYGTFSVAFAAAVLYLIQPEGGRRPLPRPEVLDEISYRAVVIGFPFLTLVIVLGAVWAQRRLEQLLELGSEGDGVARDVADLRRLPARPRRPRLARQASGLAAGGRASERRCSPTSGTSSSVACTATAGSMSRRRPTLPRIAAAEEPGMDGLAGAQAARRRRDRALEPDRGRAPPARSSSWR